MKWSHLPLIIGGVLLITAGPAVAGEGLLRLSWDGCDPIVENKDYLGDGRSQIATLVLSVSGCDLENNGHRSVLVIGPDVPDAWRFDDTGCQTGQLEIRHSGVSKACPGFQGARPLGLYLFNYVPGPRNVELDIANTYDAFTPLSGQRYTLWQARFDHRFSTSGSGGSGGACSFASSPLCFRVPGEARRPELLLVDSSITYFSWEKDWVTWQDPVNAIHCPLIQAQDSTWGKVKGLYR
jgi:hypothetical protein